MQLQAQQWLDSARANDATTAHWALRLQNSSVFVANAHTRSGAGAAVAVVCMPIALLAPSDMDVAQV